MISIISLLPIFGIATIFYIYFKKVVSVSIFFSITSIITILFVFGMFDMLKYGAYILFYGGSLLLLYMSLKFKTKLYSALKSVPFIMFTLMSIIYLYLMKDAQLFFWDEYSHWGAFIKEMYYSHAFYDTSSIASHINYPPGISIWDYFILFPSTYVEGSLYFGYFLILFSSTLMMYEKVSFKNLYWIVFIFISQMVVFASFGHWFSSIYVDHIIGSLFAGLILSFFVDKYKPYELILFIFPLISIVLVKEIGLYFGLAFVGLVILILLTREKLKNEKSLFVIIKEHRYIILILFALFISMIIVLKAWGIRQENLGVKKEHQTITGITKAIFSDDKILAHDTEEEVKKRFFEVVVHQQLHKEKISLNYNEFSYGLMSNYQSSIKLSTLGMLVFFIIISLIIIFVAKDKNKKVELSIITSYLLFVTIVYLFILYLSFLVAFGNAALRIPSYVRYMNISILPLMMIGFSLYLPIFQDINLSKKSKYKYYITSTIVLLSLVLIIKPYFKPLYSQLQNQFKQNSDSVAKSIVEELPSKSKLFVVFAVNNNGSLNNILKYSLIPLRSTVSSMKFSSKTTKEMLRTYSKYEYVWFSQLDQQLVDKNRFVLKVKNKKQIFTLYKINKRDNKIEFDPIL